MDATKTQAEYSMLDVMRIMAEAERLQKRAARKPRVPKVRYVLLMWDAEGNQYGTGRHPINTKADADRLIRNFAQSSSGPTSAALWTADEKTLVKAYESLR